MPSKETAHYRLRIRPSAPPPIGIALWAYSVMLVPATLAALLIWPWWLGAVLLVPGIALHVRSSWITAAKQGMESGYSVEQSVSMVVGALGGVVFDVLTKQIPSYCRPLLFVGFLIILVDPAWRIVFLYARRGRT